ncbi:hypothetical protein AB4043_19425 [Terriglobus sp. YAF25]
MIRLKPTLARMVVSGTRSLLSAASHKTAFITKPSKAVRTTWKKM